MKSKDVGKQQEGKRERSRGACRITELSCDLKVLTLKRNEKPLGKEKLKKCISISEREIHL